MSKSSMRYGQGYSSPEHASQELMLHSELAGVTSTNQEVCFGPSNNGWFTLFWSAAAAGTYDWIGLYKSTGDDDNDYIGGNNWQWASKGSSFVTSTACQPGYEARYLIWDANSKQYKSVARTGAFPEKICSK